MNFKGSVKSSTAWVFSAVFLCMVSMPLHTLCCQSHTLFALWCLPQYIVCASSYALFSFPHSTPHSVLSLLSSSLSHHARFSQSHTVLSAVFLCMFSMPHHTLCSPTRSSTLCSLFAVFLSMVLATHHTLCSRLHTQPHTVISAVFLSVFFIPYHALCSQSHTVLSVVFLCMFSTPHRALYSQSHTESHILFSLSSSSYVLYASSRTVFSFLYSVPHSVLCLLSGLLVSVKPKTKT